MEVFITVSSSTSRSSFSLTACVCARCLTESSNEFGSEGGSEGEREREKEICSHRYRQEPSTDAAGRQSHLTSRGHARTGAVGGRTLHNTR